ncbi:hypothetical protein C0993_008186, partial [Termitomyces sp. T159_Od127]
MAPRWTTPDELAWLKSKVPGYHQACRDNMVKRYADGVCEDWFRQWPEKNRLFLEIGARVLTEAEQASFNKAQLHTWLWHAACLNNHTSTVAQFQEIAAAAKKNKPRTRMLQEVEVYQKFFHNNVTPVVGEALSKAKPKDRRERMSVWRGMTQSALNNESEETRGKVKDMYEKLKIEHQEQRQAQKGKGHGDGGDSLRAGERMPAEYNDAINNLPAVMNAIMKPTVEATGWVFFVAAAGLKPDTNGHIFMESYYFQPDSLKGADFMASHIGFRKGFEVPFGAHVESLFSQEVREARTMATPSMHRVTANKSSTWSNELYQMDQTPSPDFDRWHDDDG